MADGKNIEIRIAATGGDQAAAEVRKVEMAQAALAEQAKQSEVLNTRGFGGMLDGVPERAEEAAVAIQKIDAAAVPLSEHLGEAAGNAEDLGDNASDAGAKLDKIINIQRAQVANQIANALGQIGSRVREASKEFAEADPEFSKTLENLAMGLDTATSAAAGAAQGFAVGGPFGAAIGALVGSAIPAFNAAMDDMVESMAGAARSEAQAAEMKRRLADAQKNTTESIFAAEDASAALAAAYENETAAADKLIEATERRNKVLAAENKADAAARDRADAAAIRGGADPENVRIERANFDEANALAKVDRDIADKKTGIKEISNAAIRAKGENEALKVTGAATPEQLADAEAKVKALEERLAKMQADLSDTEATAPARRREIRETTAGKIEDLTSQRSTRREQEAEAEKIKADAEKIKADREAERERRGGLGDRIDSAEDSLDAKSRSRGLNIVKAGQRSGNKTLQGIGNKLADGTNSDELQKIGDQVAQSQAALGAANVAALKTVLAEMQKQAAEIENLKSQIKKNRPDTR